MIVRTVLGDMAPGELGPCDAHEHLFLDTPAQPGDEFLDADKLHRDVHYAADDPYRSRPAEELADLFVEQLLVGRRLIQDQGGAPLQLTESRYVGSRYGLDIDVDVELP